MSRKNKKKISIFIMLILGICLLVGVYLLTNYWIKNRAYPTPPPQIKKVVSAKIFNLQRKNNTIQIKTSGFTKASNLVNISAEVSGKVTMLSPKLKQGKSFNKEEVLIKIDNLKYKADLAQAKANLVQAQSVYETEKAIGQSARFSNKQLGIKNTALSLRKPQIKSAKAQLKNIKTQIKLAQKNLDNTTIKADFNGTVMNRSINLGEIIAINQPLVEVVDTKQYVVEINLSNQQLGFVNLGSIVNFTDPITQTMISGTVDRISPFLNKTNRTVTLFVTINPQLPNNKILLIDSFLDASIQGRIIADSIWIPNNSIAQGQTVWYLSKKNTLKKSKIEVIYQSNTQTLIKIDSQITAIILNPNEDFYIGQKIAIDSSSN